MRKSFKLDRFNLYRPFAFSILMAALVGCASNVDPKVQLTAIGITDFSEERFLQAIADNDITAARLFLAAGMSPDVIDGSGCPIIVSALKADQKLIFRLLNEHKASMAVGCDGRTGENLLSVAIGRDDLQTFIAAIDAGADGDVIVNNMSLLDLAIRRNGEIHKLITSGSLRAKNNPERTGLVITESMITKKADGIYLSTVAVGNTSIYQLKPGNMDLTYLDAKSNVIKKFVLPARDYFVAPSYPHINPGHSYKFSFAIPKFDEIHKVAEFRYVLQYP